MPLPPVKKSKHASSSGKSTSNKRKRSPSPTPQRHPYELKLDIRMEKIEDELHSIFDIADCNMIISNSQTGFSDFSMNETFADKLDATAVMLKGCAKRVSEKATEIRDKVQSCKDHKASIQPIQFVEEITDYSKKCPKAQDMRPKRVKNQKIFALRLNISMNWTILQRTTRGLKVLVVSQMVTFNIQRPMNTIVRLTVSFANIVSQFTEAVLNLETMNQIIPWNFTDA